MEDHRQRFSLWLFRGSLALFVLSWMLPIGPAGGFNFLFAWVLFYAPFGAFVTWVYFLFEGFDASTLSRACLLSLVTVMNGFVVFVGPFVRRSLQERSGLVSMLLALATVAVVVLFEVEVGWQNPLQFGLGPLVWIGSFVLMSASCAASHFSQSLISSSTSVADHD